MLLFDIHEKRRLAHYYWLFLSTWHCMCTFVTYSGFLKCNEVHCTVATESANDVDLEYFLCRICWFLPFKINIKSTDQRLLGNWPGGSYLGVVLVTHATLEQVMNVVRK